MPMHNVTTSQQIPLKVIKADTLATRLVGLLGSNTFTGSSALHIEPCNHIHTFGMDYSIDVLFIDKNGYVIHAISQLEKNKISPNIPAAVSVLELPAGSIDKFNIKAGHHLHLIADEKHRVTSSAVQYLLHWPINLLIAILWTQFVRMSFHAWNAMGGALPMGIMVHNTLLLILFLTRRKSRDTSHMLMDWVIPILTVGATMFVRPGQTQLFASNWIPYGLQIAGMTGMIFSLLSLGRSFGVIPANRDVKSSGAYRLVRHPLYACEAVFYLGFLAGNVSIHNVLLILLVIAGQVVRAVREERLLSRDENYVDYLTRIRYRFIPGLI